MNFTVANALKWLRKHWQTASTTCKCKWIEFVRSGVVGNFLCTRHHKVMQHLAEIDVATMSCIQQEKNNRNNWTPHDKVKIESQCTQKDNHSHCFFGYFRATWHGLHLAMPGYWQRVCLLFQQLGCNEGHPGRVVDDQVVWRLFVAVHSRLELWVLMWLQFQRRFAQCWQALSALPSQRMGLCLIASSSPQNRNLMTLGTGLGPFWVWNQLTDRKGHMKVDRNPQQIPATECATRPELSPPGIWRNLEIRPANFTILLGNSSPVVMKPSCTVIMGHTWSSMRIRYTGHLSATTNWKVLDGLILSTTTRTSQWSVMINFEPWQINQIRPQIILFHPPTTVQMAMQTIGRAGSISRVTFSLLKEANAFKKTHRRIDLARYRRKSVALADQGFDFILNAYKMTEQSPW